MFMRSRERRPKDPEQLKAVLGCRFFYSCTYSVCAPLFYGLWQLRVRGRRYIPRQGGLIVAANHQSFLDPVILGVAARRPLAFMARRSLFKGFFGELIGALNAIPIPRESFTPGALRQALSALRSGWALVVFPEGTRTADGSLSALRRGVALLAALSAVPVVPAGIQGAFGVWPRFRKLPFIWGKISVAFGPIMVYDKRFDSYDGFTERLAEALFALTGSGRR